MHNVWKFIILHFITVHTKDPGGLCMLFASVPPSYSVLFPSLSLSLVFYVLLKMKDLEAKSHHYTPQIPKYVMVWPVRENNGHLLRVQNPHKQPTLEIYLDT